MDSNDSFVTNRDMYRHTVTLTAVYCVAYVIVFLVGLIGNSFVIAVVLRSPRMRTVTNFFIVNLAVADILVIVFCLPATLMSNIFVREYYHFILLNKQNACDDRGVLPNRSGKNAVCCVRSDLNMEKAKICKRRIRSM